MRTLLFTAILVLLTSCCSCPPRQVIIEYRIVPASQPTQHRPEANRALREAGRRAAQRVNQLIYHDMKATPTEIEQEIERITEEIKAMAPTNKRYDQLIRQRNQLHIDLHQAKYPVHLQREPLDSIRTINK